MLYIGTGVAFIHQLGSISKYRMRAIRLISVLKILVIAKSCSQKAYDKIGNRKLEPISIDTLTEDVLITDKRVATLYFKQSDVKEYIRKYDSLENKNGSTFPKTHELLSRNGNPRLINWWYSCTYEERKKLVGTGEYSNKDKEYIDEFFYLAPDLIRDGRFMIIDKASGEEVRKGLRMKKVKGLYGGSSIQFRLPSGEPFWYQIISLGE